MVLFCFHHTRKRIYKMLYYVDFTRSKFDKQKMSPSIIDLWSDEIKLRYKYNYINDRAINLMPYKSIMINNINSRT